MRLPVSVPKSKSLPVNLSIERNPPGQSPDFPELTFRDFDSGAVRAQRRPSAGAPDNLKASDYPHGLQAQA
jgi:hypothetical protein